MAVKALVLIEAEVGKIENVAEAISKVAGVKAVEVVTGPYDLAVSVEGADLDALGNLVIKNIHAIPNISRTITCLVVKSLPPSPARARAPRAKK